MSRDKSTDGWLPRVGLLLCVTTAGCSTSGAMPEDAFVAQMRAVDTGAPRTDSAMAPDATALDATAAGDAAMADAAALDATSVDASRDAFVPRDTGSTTADAGVGIACGSGFTTEVFRDDFDGTALDTTRWGVVQQRPGGSAFTQMTTMIRDNVSVSGGMLHVASRRHCVDPYPSGAPAHPAACGGTTFYSGGWLRSNGSFAPGHGLAIFLAHMPTPVRGSFPALWMRNTDGTTRYGELDLIEQWWDTTRSGVVGDPDAYSATTWMSPGTAGAALVDTHNNAVGHFTGLDTSPHVWEVEWDASVPRIVYYFRDAPGAARQVVRTVDATTPGFQGVVSAAQLTSALSLGWRPYIDFAIQPATSYHSSPDEPAPAAPIYAPDDLLVDSVIVCAP